LKNISSEVYLFLEKFLEEEDITISESENPYSQKMDFYRLNMKNKYFLPTSLFVLEIEEKDLSLFKNEISDIKRSSVAISKSIIKKIREDLRGLYTPRISTLVFVKRENTLFEVCLSESLTLPISLSKALKHSLCHIQYYSGDQNHFMDTYKSMFSRIKDPKYNQIADLTNLEESKGIDIEIPTFYENKFLTKER
jgi:hypothetical protein